MKVIEIRAYLLESPLERPFAYSRGWLDRRGPRPARYQSLTLSDLGLLPIP